MATPQQGNNLVIPGASELQVVQQTMDLLNPALGRGGSGPAPAGAMMPMNPNLTAQDLNNLMTNFLRTDGQFLQTMRQQNQSGMYNTNTRMLLQNDLLSQAALKATQGQLAVNDSNARIAAANAQIANANRGSGATGPKQPNKWEARRQLALALGLMYGRSAGGAATLGNAWDSSKQFVNETFFGQNPLNNLNEMSGIDELPYAAPGFQPSTGEFAIDPSAMQAFEANSAANLASSLSFDPFATADFSDFDFSGIIGADLSGIGQDLSLAEGMGDLDWSMFEGGADMASAYF